jgi:hypothetical protein
VTMTMKAAALAAALLALAPRGVARAAEGGAGGGGEEVEVTSGVVTGTSCALEAREKGDLRILTSCPPAEAQKGMVVFDVAEKRIYRLSEKKVLRFMLESAYGGGSIDFTGKTVKLDPKTAIATVDVSEFSITKKPKPGAFKGCL